MFLASKFVSPPKEFQQKQMKQTVLENFLVPRASSSGRNFEAPAKKRKRIIQSRITMFFN
jgi:hypothetical protein